MDILTGDHQAFLSFLPEIKKNIAEWQLVNVKLVGESDATFTIHNVGGLLKSYFQDKDGKIYIFNERELIMLIRHAADDPAGLAQQVETALPQGKCTYKVAPPTSENISRIVIDIRFEPEPVSDHMMKRRTRVENVILIADDDMYMRTLVKKGFPSSFTMQEVIHGGEIVAAYKKYNPDLVLLDIHMPGKDGLENLQSILSYDPQAFVIMLSSDSSQENVLWTNNHGAKGFLAKPFNKDRLLELVKRCPTIT